MSQKKNRPATVWISNPDDTLAYCLGSDSSAIAVISELPDDPLTVDRIPFAVPGDGRDFADFGSPVTQVIRYALAMLGEVAERACWSDDGGVAFLAATESYLESKADARDPYLYFGDSVV